MISVHRSLFLLMLCCVTGPAASPPVMYVRLLGTGGPSLGYNPAEAGLLVVAGPEVLLFDCGQGIPDRLYELNGLPFTSPFGSHRRVT
jgi:hypothetical protein